MVCRLHAASFLLLIAQASAQPPVVTDTTRVSVGSRSTMLLRKINNRWWTTDNRMVSPPGKGGVFWVVDSKPGVVEFHHHRPFDLRKAEWLHLFMTPDQVEGMFGPPNRRFPMRSERGGMWYYIAADGTILDIWFMERDELGKATYRPVGGSERSVATIEQELGGQSIFSLMAARASGRTPSIGRRSTAPTVALERPLDPPKPLLKRIISLEALREIQPGVPRADLIARLGEPTYQTSFTGDDGVRETLTYHLDENTPAIIRLVDGKVVQVR